MARAKLSKPSSTAASPSTIWWPPEGCQKKMRCWCRFMPMSLANPSRCPVLRKPRRWARPCTRQWAGSYPNIRAAAEVMGKLKPEVVKPIPAHQRVYERLYADYATLYDYFGRGANDVMKRLKRLRFEALGNQDLVNGALPQEA